MVDGRSLHESELLCEGLGWPEGPSALADGTIVFVESYASQITQWTAERGRERYAYTAGAPNSCVVGRDDAIYVCQNGGTVGPWRAPEMSVPSIQRVDRRDGKAEILMTSVEGVALRGPNDLVFGNDGTLYFTDPGTYNPASPEPSYIHALRPDGTAEVVVEFPEPVFPNGLAVTNDGALVWDESYTGRISRTRGVRGTIEDLGRLPGDNPIPDGMKIAADGRMYVSDLVGNGLHVLAPDGGVESFIPIGPAPTNCLFVDGDLYVTVAGRVADDGDASMNGSLWRLQLGVPGQSLTRGAIDR